MSNKALVVAPGEGPCHFILGDLVTVKIHGRDTGGVYSVIENTAPPLSGPPPHIHHREDETFYVIDGEFEFICGGERTVGGPGTVARMPRGVPHQFRNLRETPGRVLVTITPSGFEDFFAEIGAIPPDEQSDIPRILEIAARYGLEFVPPAGDVQGVV